MHEHPSRGAFGGGLPETHCAVADIQSRAGSIIVTAVTGFYKDDFWTKDNPANDQFEVKVTSEDIEVCWYAPREDYPDYSTTDHPVVGIKVKNGTIGDVTYNG